MKRFAGLAAALLFLAASASAKSRNVVLLIGDGMGLSVLGLGRDYSETVLKIPFRIREVMNAGHAGLVTTRSADRLVTDSAAAATAIACGELTVNDRVGMDETGRPLTNLLELARERGLAVGIVTTDRLTGATPAAFSAHASHRSQSDLIAAQQIKAKFDLLFGGGAEEFDLARAEKDGYRVLRTKKDLAKSKSAKPGPWLGAFHAAEFPWVAERGAELPSLLDMTRAALDRLSADPEGFLLVVEGARIDHAGHANLTPQLLAELAEFDAVVGTVADFTAARSDTTMFVTADHDTGGAGATKLGRLDPYPGRDGLADPKNVFWLSGHHTAGPVLLAGLGPDSAGAAGWHEHTALFRLVKAALGL